MLASPDTIFAPATPATRSAIAVIRISGPDSGAALDRLAGTPRPEARRATLRRLRDPATDDILDQALVLWLPGPASFTGEDQAELHIHGGQAVRAAILRALAGLPGLRPAEAGEFTRQAFLAGRLDLAAVEGLADLIDAETEAQRRQAVRQMEGGLGAKTEAWRERLLDAAATLSASLDFSDEDDIPSDISRDVRDILETTDREIGEILRQATRGERIRDGWIVVIAGPPNAGKSTLLNALARRDVAIVSPIPGTTRDAIEVRCDIDGYPVTFVDTAGLHETDDPVERQGIARSERRMAEADLVLWLTPLQALRPLEGMAGHADGSPPRHAEEVRHAPSRSTHDRACFEMRPAGAPQHDDGRVLPVATKADLAPALTSGLAISAETCYGLDALIDAIRERLALGGGSAAGDALVTRERHRLALGEALEAIRRAASAMADGAEDLAAEDLRLALRALGRITGRVDVEAILDRVFGQFCIGK